MAIDIILKDGIDASIETKMRGIANAAASLNRSMSTLEKKMAILNAGGTGSMAAGALAGITPALNSRAKAAEAALSTRARDVNAATSNLTRTLNQGMANNDKQINQLMRRLERARPPLDFDRVLGVNRANAPNANRQQAMYDRLFGAHNITTQAPKIDYARVIAERTGANLNQVSQAVINRQQRMYNDLFGAIQQNTHRLSTSTQRLDFDRILGVNRPQMGASMQARQQRMYDNLFGAQPPVPPPSRGAGASAGGSSGRNPYGASTAGARSMANANNLVASSARNASSAMGQLETSVGFLRSDGLRWAKVLWALGGATLTAGAIVDAADAYTRLQNRLSVVADTQGKVNQLTDEMLRISNASRQPIEATAKTFARLDLAMNQLGRSQKDSMQLTENVAKALKLGGATAGEAASALLQVSQAFNKGKLDGDEFRSVMENSPILANALAKSLNVTRGELLKLAPQGKITAQVMADAFLAATDDINKSFGRLKITIAESFTILRNNMTIYLGRLNESIGFTAALSGAVAFLANNLDSLTFIFLTLAPIVAGFITTQAIAALSIFGGFITRTAMSIGAMRSPITVAAVGLATMGRNAVAAGVSMVTAFNSGIGRAIALQMAIVRTATAVAALANVARAASVAMLGMFSFGNVVLAITVATAAALAFGDQLIMSAESGATLRDYTVAIFQEIGAFAVSAFEGIYDTIAEYFGYSIDEGQTLADKIGNSFFAISLAAAVTVDAISTVLSNLWNIVKSTIYLIGDAIYNTMAFAANAVLSLVNGAIDSLNSLTSFANVILNATGASSIVGEFGQIGKMAGFEYKSQFLDSLGDFGVKHDAADMVMTMRERIGERAAANAKERGKKDEALRAYDAAQAAKAAAAADKDKKKEKKPKKSDEEKRADIIKKVVNAETSAALVARRYGDEKERLNVIEDLNNKLKQKGYAILSEGEGGEKQLIDNLVRQRLEAERVGAAMETIYGNTKVKLLKDYTAAYDAANAMMQQNMITEEHMINLQKQAMNVFNEATDPIFSFTQELDKARAMYGKFGEDAIVAAAMYERAQKLIEDGKAPMTPEQSKQLIETVRATTQLTTAQDALNNVWQQAAGATEDVKVRMDALNTALNVGMIATATYSQQFYGLMAEMSRVQEIQFGVVDPFEPMRRGFYQFASEVPLLGQGMADAISNTLGNAVDNLSSTLTDMIMNFDAYGEKVADALQRPVSTLDIMRYAIGDIVQQIGKELINAIIKMGVQWAVTRAMQAAADKAAIATTTAAQVGSMGVIAASAAPAAMATSVATAGGSAAAGMSGMTMAMLAVGGIMALAMTAGKFKDGGELGGMGTGRSDSTLFWGSRGEMIMNKDAVEANRPMLQAMNSGAAVGATFIDNSVHVSVTYNGNGDRQQSGNDTGFTQELVRFIDSRVHKGVMNNMRQGKQGYGV